MLTNKETSDEGKFTRQFFRWTRDNSAAVDCAFLREAIVGLDTCEGHSCDRCDVVLGGYMS